MDYETEEQQLEALKKWWKENAVMVIGGVALGASAIFGWQYYQQQTVVKAKQASALFEQVSGNIHDPQKANEQQQTTNTLQGEYADTPYASLAALLLAKQQLANGEVAKAQQQLHWVIEHSSQDELKYLAKIRLARLLVGSEQSDKALALLSETYPASFQSMVDELKGDALLLQGKMEQARSAYEKALSGADGTSSTRWLQLKIDDLAVKNTLEPEAASKVEPSA